MHKPAVPLKEPGKRVSLQVHRDDNVVTLLDSDTTCRHLIDGTEIQAGVPFGHKVAVCAIDVGSPVIKYGVTIGIALKPIAKGEHVHVHNLA